MADIRINALATTAASTASDDFIAVDGSANGTRKLNAYSPTFGGNLTVSGTVAASGDLKLGVAQTSQFSANRFSIINSATNNQKVSYELMVNDGTDNNRFAMFVDDNAHTLGFDTGTSNGNYNGLSFSIEGSQKLLIDRSGNLYLGDSSTSGNFYIGPAMISSNGGANPLKFGINATEQMRLFANGNLFVGASPVDGGQKLQVSGTAYVSGATTLGGNLTINTSGNSFVELLTSGVQKSNWQLSGDNVFFDCNSGTLNFRTLSASNITLRTNSTTALTLDSSQNATFAGSIAINNTVQTAVSVASTHKVTISIGGSTYYLLATNV